jgi:hypothetical protein
MIRNAKRRGRRTDSSRSVKIPLSAEELARVEALAAQMVMPGIWASRSDVLRMLLLIATQGAEKAPVRFKLRHRRRQAV